MTSRRTIRPARANWPAHARTVAATKVATVTATRSRKSGSNRFIRGMVTLYHKAQRLAIRRAGFFECAASGHARVTIVW